MSRPKGFVLSSDYSEKELLGKQDEIIDIIQRVSSGERNGFLLVGEVLPKKDSIHSTGIVSICFDREILMRAISDCVDSILPVPDLTSATSKEIDLTKYL